MDDDAHLVTKAGREVTLSPTEYNLLRYLLVNCGRVVSKAQILDHVWDYDFGGGGVVETYIGYLRRKLDTTTLRDVRAVSSKPVTVVGAEGRIRQVVANLVANALVHAPGAPIEVRVRTEGGHAVVEVADEGPGMSPADAARAFERFYRADTSRSRHQGGSGLGLSIVEATVRAHGGTTSLTTAPGQGTAIRIELPLESTSHASPVAH